MTLLVNSSGKNSFGSTASDYIADVAVDSNDNVYIFGHTTAQNGETFDGVTISKAGLANDNTWFIIKFDKDGNKQWAQHIDKTTNNNGSLHGTWIFIKIAFT